MKPVYRKAATLITAYSLAITLAFAIALFFGVSASKAEELQTIVVKQQVVENLRQFEGNVEAVEKSTISAQTSGRVTQINFDVNDYVKSGTIILRFADNEHKARVKQAESALNAASARYLAATQSFERTSALFKNGTVAKALFDTEKSTLDAAKAGKESATAALVQAREQLAYTVVTAPYSGFVVKRHVQIGEIANPGQPLMTGFSLKKLRVKADVPQQFADAIRKGNTAIVYGPGGIKIISNALTVFPFADPATNTVTVRIALPKGTKSMFPGMLIKTAFKIGQRSVIAIPKAAIVRRGEIIGAYILGKDNKPILQQIRTGRQIGSDAIEVLSGLQIGDNIALDPLQTAISLKAGNK